MDRTRAEIPPAGAPSLLAAVELLKPITWFPPMWAYGCGVVSSGQPLSGRWPLLIAGILLAGPLVCGASQVVNDWYDRNVDAINEPGRPIPSGRMPGQSGLFLAIGWTILSLLVGTVLGTWGFVATVVGLVLAWLYSAPPIRLKQNGWWGNSAVALSYEGLPWFTGAAVMTASAPDLRVILLAVLYSLGAHGIMTINDFKSLEGDRQLGVRTLPVQHGERGAALLTCIFMATAQVIVVGLLLSWDRPLHAAGVTVLLLGQLPAMRKWLTRPKELAPWFNGAAISLYAFGMLASAFALRSA
ncbi:MAG: chlorophyll synthase ChlG [Gammaproteobacteria bacterium]